MRKIIKLTKDGSKLEATEDRFDWSDLHTNIETMRVFLKAIANTEFRKSVVYPSAAQIDGFSDKAVRNMAFLVPKPSSEIILMVDVSVLAGDRLAVYDKCSEVSRVMTRDSG